MAGIKFASVGIIKDCLSGFIYCKPWTKLALCDIIDSFEATCTILLAFTFDAFLSGTQCGVIEVNIQSGKDSPPYTGTSNCIILAIIN